jgi:hypothetical protein
MAAGRNAKLLLAAEKALATGNSAQVEDWMGLVAEPAWAPTNAALAEEQGGQGVALAGASPMSQSPRNLLRR